MAVGSIPLPSPPSPPLASPSPPLLPSSPLSPPSPTFSSDSSDSDALPSSHPPTSPPSPHPFHPLPLLPPPHTVHLPLAPSPPTLTGRTHQRYHNGQRLVCGAIPFILSPPPSPPSPLLLTLRSLPPPLPGGGAPIGAEACGEWIFPKGGWESFESGEQCAAREVMEEGGVEGRLVLDLGAVDVRSGKGKRGRLSMWAMQVERVYERWNDRERRERRWMTMGEARALVRRAEMREMLSRFELRMGQLLDSQGQGEGSAGEGGRSLGGRRGEGKEEWDEERKEEVVEGVGEARLQKLDGN